jgi:hypothetical protein
VAHAAASGGEDGRGGINGEGVRAVVMTAVVRAVEGVMAVERAAAVRGARVDACGAGHLMHACGG